MECERKTGFRVINKPRVSWRNTGHSRTLRIIFRVQYQHVINIQSFRDTFALRCFKIEPRISRMICEELGNDPHQRPRTKAIIIEIFCINLIYYKYRSLTRQETEREWSRLRGVVHPAANSLEDRLPWRQASLPTELVIDRSSLEIFLNRLP